MLTLDDGDELDLVLCALGRFKAELVWQCSDRNSSQVKGSAFWACEHFVMPRVDVLIERIEEYRKDVEEERDGG